MGLACGKCKENFYRDEDLCRQCEDADEEYFYTLVTVAVVVLILVIVALGALVKYIPYALYGTMGITIFFFQMIGLFRQIELEWPSSMQWTLDAFSFFVINLSIFRAECAVGSFDHWHRSVIVLAIPVSLLVLVSGLKWVRVALCSSDDMDEVRKTTGQVAVITTTVGFAFVAQQIISLVDCRWQPAPKVYTLSSEPTQVCFSDPVWLSAYLPLLILAVVVYLSSIITINKAVSNNRDSLRNMNSLTFKSVQGWYYKYRRSQPFWETWMLLDKFAIVLTITLLSRWPTRTCLTLLVILSAMFLHQWLKKPFACEENNLLMQITTGSLLFVIITSSLLYTPIPDRNKHQIGPLTTFEGSIRLHQLHSHIRVCCADLVLLLLPQQGVPLREAAEEASSPSNVSSFI